MLRDRFRFCPAFKFKCIDRAVARLTLLSMLVQISILVLAPIIVALSIVARRLQLRDMPRAEVLQETGFDEDATEDGAVQKEGDDDIESKDGESLESGT